MQHKDVKKGNVHIIHNFEFANVNEMNGYVASVEDLNKVALVNAPYGFYALKSIEPIEWKILGGVEVNVGDLDVYSKEEVEQLIAEKEEVYKSDVNPTTTINPKNKGSLWVNFNECDIYICMDNLKDKNIWKSVKSGKIIAPEKTWIIPEKGTVIHQKFTANAQMISSKEYKENNITIRTNTIPLAGYELYKALDNSTEWSGGTYLTSWGSDTTPLPNWIEIETEEKRIANVFKFMQPYNSANCIKKIVIQGSNDGLNYTDLQTISNIPQTFFTFQSFTIEKAGEYRIYRVNIIEKYGTGIGCASMEFVY